MPRRFSASAQNIAGATGGAHLISVPGIANVAVMGQEVIVGMDAVTPQDYAGNFSFQRFTAAPTGGGAVTPVALDQGTAATVLTAVQSAPTGGTLVTPGIAFGLNMRAAFRWIAQPGWELVCYSGTANGLLLRTDKQSTAFATVGTVLYQE